MLKPEAAQKQLAEWRVDDEEVEELEDGDSIGLIQKPLSKLPKKLKSVAY